MPRVRKGAARSRKHKKVLKSARGYIGAASRRYRIAREARLRAGQYATIGRKLKKRDFRRLWITRISAACRQRGQTYSRFMHALAEKGISVNRKMLADLAVSDPAAFEELFAAAAATGAPAAKPAAKEPEKEASPEAQAEAPKPKPAARERKEKKPRPKAEDETKVAKPKRAAGKAPAAKGGKATKAKPAPAKKKPAAPAKKKPAAPAKKKPAAPAKKKPAAPAKKKPAAKKPRKTKGSGQ